MPPTTRRQSGASSGSSDEKLSVIVPTYNERENLPILVWLLVRTMEERCAPARTARHQPMRLEAVRSPSSLLMRLILCACG